MIQTSKRVFVDGEGAHAAKMTMKFIRIV